MDRIASDRFHTRWHDDVEGIRRAILRALADGAGPPGDMPSGEQTREVLGLFARLQSDDLRRAVLGLMRTIVETGTHTR